MIFPEIKWFSGGLRIKEWYFQRKSDLEEGGGLKNDISREVVI